MSEWIKTSERKPPEGEQVWTWMGGWEKVERMYLRNDIWYHDTVTGGSTYGGVDTIEWWRPLPPPPGTPTDAAPPEREVLLELRAMLSCTPETPWRGCEAQEYSNDAHYMAHSDEALQLIDEMLRESNDRAD